MGLIFYTVITLMSLIFTSTASADDISIKNISVCLPDVSVSVVTGIDLNTAFINGELGVRKLKLANIKRDSDNAYTLYLQSEGNIVYNTYENLHIQVLTNGKSITLDKSVLVSEWQPDNTPPYIKSIEQLSPMRLKVYFSENMQNIKEVSITNDIGQNVEIEAISADADVCEIVTHKKLYYGEYTVSFPGATDASMEANALAGGFIFHSLSDTNKLPPSIIIAQQVTSSVFKVAYNKDMKNADQTAYYELYDQLGNRIPINKITHENTYYLLYTSERLWKNTYTLYINSSITDYTDEANTITTPYKFEGIGRSRVFFYIWVIPVLLSVVALGIIITGLVYKRKKQVAINHTIKPVDKKYVINTPDMVTLHLIIIDKSQNVSDHRFHVDSSFIVGRNKSCNLSFTDDALMSRQHFALEVSSKSFIIMDLDSENGTIVNGVQLFHKRVLNDGDKIEAGQEIFIFRMN